MSDVTETHLFFRDGHLVHSHQDRAVFERWMADAPERYPAERCEIVRFVPENEVAAAEARGREEDAALVRTAGCQCDRLGGAVWELPSGRGITSPGPKRDRPVKIHNRACPVALAAEILEGR